MCRVLFPPSSLPMGKLSGGDQLDVVMKQLNERGGGGGKPMDYKILTGRDV
jgi:hypothetical protein